MNRFEAAQIFGLLSDADDLNVRIIVDYVLANLGRYQVFRNGLALPRYVRPFALV